MYFVYKLNRIPGIGGIMPTSGVDEDLGLAVFGEWYLGKCENATYLDTMREFSPYPCSDDVGAGFRFLGVETVLDGEEERPLNEAEIALKATAQMFVAKLTLRPTIETQVGDTADQMADMAKRVALLERAVIHIYGHVKNETPIPDEWVALLDLFYSDITTQAILDPVDIRPDGYDGVYAILKGRSNDLTEIMRPFYGG